MSCIPYRVPPKRSIPVPETRKNPVGCLYFAVPRPCLLRKPAAFMFEQPDLESDVRILMLRTL